MNHPNITTAVLLLLSAATVQARDTDNNGFIDSLMAEMSIEEKIGHLNLPVGGDVVHGYETVFPIPLALSCSWDSTAIAEMARISEVFSPKRMFMDIRATGCVLTHPLWLV